MLGSSSSDRVDQSDLSSCCVVASVSVVSFSPSFGRGGFRVVGGLGGAAAERAPEAAAQRRVDLGPNAGILRLRSCWFGPFLPRLLS